MSTVWAISRTDSKDRAQSQASPGVFALSVVFIAVGVLLLSLFPWSTSYTSLDRQNYSILFCLFFEISILTILAARWGGLVLLEPYSIVVILWLCILVLYPMRDVLAHDMVTHGKDVANGCAPATAIAIVSYLAFYLLYFAGRANSRTKVERDGEKTTGQFSPGGRSRIITLMLVIWIISFACALYVLLQSGMTLSYIFSLGARGEIEVSESQTTLLFLSNFGITLVGAWTFLLFSPTSIFLKVIITILTIVYILARMSRWLVLVAAVAPIIYYFTFNKKQVKLRHLLIVGLAFLLIAAWMQVYRYGFKRGNASTITTAD